MTSTPPPLLTDIANDAALGGKSRSIAQLRAAQLPTPDGFVVTDALFRALHPDHPIGPGPLDGPALANLSRDARRVQEAPFPASFEQQLAARLAQLGGERFSVRSSFALEDHPGAVAAGVFDSRIDLPAAEVPAAVRAVLASALSPGAAAYARAHGRRPGQAPVAVLVHRFVAGDAAGGGAWDPGRPERPPLIDVRVGRPSLGATETIRQAMETLARQHGPVEIEWTAQGDAVTFLQLRPYAPPPPAPPWRGWSELDDGTVPEAWRWDAAHNPLPLSRAHAGLIAAVDERCRIGIRQRVLGGYLFWSPDGPLSPERLDPAELPAGLARLNQDIDRHVISLAGPPSLEAALAGFLPLYERLLGVLQPAARAARAELAELLRAESRDALALLPTLLADVPSRAQDRLRLAELLAAATEPDTRQRALDQYLDVFGDEAQAWDVAAPTNREQPRVLLATLTATGRATNGGAATGTTNGRTTAMTWQDAARTCREMLPASARDNFDRALQAARAAVAAGEDDDWLYARLQAPVRHAIRALGDRLVVAGALEQAEDAFHLPLGWLRSFAAGRPSLGDVQRLADQGRAAHQDALLHPPPLPVDAGTRGPTARGSSMAASPPVLRGSGTTGRAVGKVVHRHGPFGAAPPTDAVLVATSLLPTELPLIRAAALVCETGGPLDHVATQARERGLPAVVGVVGAVAALAEGDTVVVDGDAGVVVKAGR